MSVRDELTEGQKEFFKSDFGDFWPFLESVDFDRDPLLIRIEEECQARGVYSVGHWFGRLLNFLVRFGRVRNALEFGTATGYSAIWIARGLDDGHLTTLERDSDLADLARANLKRAGVADFVEVLTGDAENTIASISGPVDFMFVDCSHVLALEKAEKLLRVGGMFVCDNVGFSNKTSFNADVVGCSYLETLYIHGYLKGRIPENQAFSISLRV